MDKRRLTSRALSEVNNSWLAALRVLLGLVMAWSAARYLLFGWVERFFIRPTFFFTYPGFDWVTPLSSAVLMKGTFVVLIGLGLMVSVGLFFRFACIAFTAIFTWIWLTDVTNFLNHYYLLTLLGVLLAASPANRRWSFDARLGLVEPSANVSRGILWLFRVQVAIVYFYAGIAKLQPDWLIHAQPLNSWLLARSDYPILGSLFQYWEVALAMSWAGFLFDSTIWVWLLWPRTRRVAYVVVIAFHAMTAYLFDIGIFPLIMTFAATVLLSPDWAESIVGGMRRRAGLTLHEGALASRVAETSREQATDDKSVLPDRSREYALAIAAAVLWVSIQAVVPARSFAYGGNVLWHEQGMKWSWRVMVRSKYGEVSYRVMRPDGHEFVVQPSEYLTSYQEREMSSRPELILQLGRRIGAEYAQEFGAPVPVRAITSVSLNTRSPQPIVDPSVDLMQLSRLAPHADWITDSPVSRPLHLGRRILEHSP